MTLVYSINNTQQKYIEKDNYYQIDQKDLDDFVDNNQYVLVYFRKPNTDIIDKNDQEFQKVLENKKDKNMYVVCKVETKDLDLPNYRIYLSGFYRDFDFEPQYRRILSWSKINFTRKSKLQKLEKKQLKMLQRLQNFLVFKYPKSDKDFERKLQDFSKIKISTKIFWTEENFDFQFKGNQYEMMIGRNFADGNKIYSQDAAFQSSFMQQMFEFLSHPHVVVYQPEHQQKLFDGKKAVVYFDNENNQNINKYSEISSKFSDKIISFLTGMSKEHSVQLARFLDVDKKKFPTVRALQYSMKNRKWQKFKPLEEQNHEEFIASFVQNKQQEFFKQEPIPEHERNYQFKKIVRGNFEEVVNDKNKHVLIAFVTDWCEHCKEIKPAFNEIKVILKDEIKDITFGIINVDKNDIDITLKNYPTIYFYKKGQKDKPVNYDGMRDAEVILNFIEDQLGGNVAIYNRKMPEELRKKQEEMQQKIKEQQEQYQQQNEEYDL